MASTNIQRSISGSATDGKKFTLSGWFKLSSTTSHMGVLGSIYTAWNGRGNAQIGIYNNRPYFWYRNENNDTKYVQEGQNYMRDLNAWYHLVWVFDSTQATASDRIKIYINGQVQTVGSSLYPPQNEVNGFINNGHTQYVGKYNFTDGSVNYWNGYMSHLHLCDGYAYSASDFGETDSTTGEWRIKTTPSVSYGNHGWWLFKNDNSLTDRSGNGNNFSSHNGTLLPTEDNPSNIFATMNPLSNNDVYSFSNGNLRCSHSGQWEGSNSTLGMISGKWYWEVKYISGNCGIGIGREGNLATATGNNSSLNVGYAGKQSGGYELFKNGSNSQKINNDTTSSYGTVPSANDIYMVAFDADIGAIWVGLNGTWFDSATEAEIEAGTTTNSAYTGKSFSTNSIIPAVSAYQHLGNSIVEANFGNPAFSISSGNSDGNGYGNFEYSVPSGYYALNTKNLAEYG